MGDSLERETEWVPHQSRGQKGYSEMQGKKMKQEMFIWKAPPEKNKPEVTMREDHFASAVASMWDICSLVQPTGRTHTFQDH